MATLRKEMSPITKRVIANIDGNVEKAQMLQRNPVLFLTITILIGTTGTAKARHSHRRISTFIAMTEMQVQVEMDGMNKAGRRKELRVPPGTLAPGAPLARKTKDNRVLALLGRPSPNQRVPER